MDTSGAYCGVGAEERGQGEAIAENMYEMMTAKDADPQHRHRRGRQRRRCWRWPWPTKYGCSRTPTIQSSRPRARASILWKDAKRAKEAAESLRLTAQDLYDLGVIENIIPAAQTREAGMPRLKQALSEAFSRRAALDTATLLEQRYRKFRGIGGGKHDRHRDRQHGLSDP